LKKKSDIVRRIKFKHSLILDRKDIWLMDVQDYSTGQGSSQDKDGLAGLCSGDLTASLLAAPVGICVIKGRIIEWGNPAFYRMLGRPQGSLESKDIAALYPTPKEFLRVGGRLDTQVRQFGTGMVDTRLLRSDGTAFDCRVRAALLYPEKASSAMVLYASDITEIKSLNTQQQQAQKMEAISVLAGGISHDFNNLLMGVQGHLSLMRINVDSPEKITSHIQQIGKLVETAADLTSRLLGFARGGKYQISVLDIHQVLSVALNIFKPAHRGITILEHFDANPLAVDGDSSQLEKVMLNLLVNGSQAMVDSGTIHVTTRSIYVDEHHGYHFEVAPGSYAEISVRDEGIGMDEDTRKKVFDPFFSTKEIGNQKGRGLGLSTVYGIVKNHGGFITVDSKKGHGSDFRVCLPCSQHPPDKVSDSEENTLEKMPKGSETILFADDEAEILNLGREFLKKQGYRTLLARNGKEAVEVFQQHSHEISLAVLDLIMPEMDGKEAFFEMRKIRPDIKVLVSTGFNVDEDVEALLDQGCYGFLQKPFSMHKFLQTIREILDCTDTCRPDK